MRSLDDRLNAIRGATTDLRTEVLAEAYSHARDDEALGLGEALASTGSPRAVAELIRSMDRLGPRGLQIVGDVVVDRSAVTRLLLADGGGRTLRNACRVVGRWGEATALPSLIERLNPDDRDLSRAIATTVLSVTLRQLGPLGIGHPDPRQADGLRRGLARAAARFSEHRDDMIALAIAVASRRPGPELKAMLDDDQSTIRLALGRVTGRLDQAIVRRNLLRWLDTQAMARQSLRAIRALDGSAAWADALSGSHLLRGHRRRAVTRSVDRSMGFVPGPAVATRLPARTQRGLVDYLGSLGLSHRVLMGHLAQLAELSCPIARLGCIEQIRTRDGRHARGAMERFTRDANPYLARLALRSIPGAGEDHELLAAMSVHHDAPLARAARRRLAATSLASFAANWLMLTPQDAMAAARSLAPGERERLPIVLKQAIESAEPRARLAAIMLARRLGLESKLRRSIMVEIKSDSARLVSAAIAALGPVLRRRPGDERLSRSIARALDHEDARVRANAVEALGAAAKGAARDRIRGIAEADRNRPRANAIRAELRFDPDRGVRDLRRMLEDEDPLHRVSAVWAARRGRASAVSDQLRVLATTDPMRVVRRRASAAAGMLSPGEGAVA